MTEWAWIPITIWAALCQTTRTALQKQLKGRLSTNGASVTRFLYGMPLALGWLAVLVFALGKPVPPANLEFILWMLAGALAQIVATNLLIMALNLHNFMVGTAYSKTEAIQAALFGMLLLGETVSLGGVAAILLGTVGVMLMSLKNAADPKRAFLWGWSERPALIGIASGGFFAVSAIALRAASLSLNEADLPLAAATTLAYTTVFQTVVMFAYLAWREPGEIARVFRAWKPGIMVGIFSAAGSAGWFTAMALQVAAYVRMLGLIEMLFNFLITVLIFREKPGRAEIAGVLLLMLGILLALGSH